MLPILAGLAGLALMGNPFRAKRRNPKRRRNPGSQPYDYTVERVHISRIAPGDIVQCTDGHHRTVGRHDIKSGGLFGRTLFGDSYRAGRLLVERVVIKRAGRNPGRRKAVTPSGAGARLAKWRWHHNPGWESAYPAGIVKAGRIALAGGEDSMGTDDALREAGVPVTKANLHHMRDYLEDAAISAGRNPGTREARYQLADGSVVSASGLRRMFMGKIPGPKHRKLLGISRLKSNPGRYARLDAKAVAKARLNIRSGGQPHTVWDAVRTQSAAGRARRTLTYGQRSRLSKRIAFEYQKAIKAGKRRRSR